jgi:DTW domain-containing protein YfiP
MPHFSRKKSPITTLKTAGHWTLSGTDKFISYSANTFLSDISITAVLPNSHLHHPNYLFPSTFRAEILYALLISAMHVTFPSHFILFTGRPDKSWKNFSLFYFLHDFSTISISRTRYSPYQSVSKDSNEVLCALNVKTSDMMREDNEVF